MGWCVHMPSWIVYHVQGDAICCVTLVLSSPASWRIMRSSVESQAPKDAGTAELGSKWVQIRRCKRFAWRGGVIVGPDEAFVRSRGPPNPYLRPGAGSGARRRHYSVFWWEALSFKDPLSAPCRLPSHIIPLHTRLPLQRLFPHRHLYHRPILRAARKPPT